MKLARIYDDVKFKQICRVFMDIYHTLVKYNILYRMSILHPYNFLSKLSKSIRDIE